MKVCRHSRRCLLPDMIDHASSSLRSSPASTSYLPATLPDAAAAAVRAVCGGAGHPIPARQHELFRPFTSTARTFWVELEGRLIHRRMVEAVNGTAVFRKLQEVERRWVLFFCGRCAEDECEWRESLISRFWPLCRGTSRWWMR